MRFVPPVKGHCAMAQSTRDTGSVADIHDTESGRKVADHYREYAAQIRDLADGEPDIGLRSRLTTIANQYEAMVDYIDPQPERRARLRPGSGGRRQREAVGGDRRFQ